MRNSIKLGSTTSRRVFISYSHKDKKHLERLITHLAYFVQQGEIDLWSDARIMSGSDWQSEIVAAITTARAAILLVSADFLASKFIMTEEVPRLLEAASSRGTIILPVIVSASNFSDTLLGRFQAVNNPDKPLNSLRGYRREIIWVDVTKSVRNVLNADVVNTVDLPTVPANNTFISAQHLAGRDAPYKFTVEDAIDFLMAHGWQIDLVSSQHSYWLLKHKGHRYPIVITGHLNDQIAAKAAQRLKEIA